MNEFVTWVNLATYGGALAMVLVLTQATKELPFVSKLPTQLWSYILSLVVLLAATYFTSTLTASSIGLAVFNAAIISMAANGGYEAISRVAGGKDNA